MRLAVHACGALEAAHRLGIIHRDIKPANILVAQGTDGSDVVKVMDFGVAKVKEKSTLAMGASLTRTGFVVGTPEYMSPEQARGARGEELDGRTDLYSLGVVLYEMLTGRLPFTADTPVMMLMAHVQTEPLDPRTLRADLPEPLVNLVLRVLEKEPARRFASAEAMREALETIERDRTVRLTLVPAPSVVRGIPPPQGRLSPPGAKQATLPTPPVFTPPAELSSPSGWRYAAVGGLASVAVVAGLLFFRGGPPTASPAREAPAPTSESSPPPATPEPAAPPPQTFPAKGLEKRQPQDSQEVRKLLQYGRDALRRGDRQSAAAFFR